VKKAFPLALVALGLVFLGAGAATVLRGFDAKEQVREALVAQRLTTPADASIPNARVDDAATAASMAAAVGVHELAANAGDGYPAGGRFLALDGSGTNDEARALKNEHGAPLANPLRGAAFRTSSLRASLYTSVTAFDVADVVIGLGLLIAVLGLAVGGLGVALVGLAFPALARPAHLEPAAAGR